MNQLNDFTTKISIPVQWGDMDAYQHVNNLVYLRWIESARVKFFEDHLTNGEISDADVGPILASQYCKYIFAVTYPDTVHIGYRVKEIMEDRLICESEIYSEKYNRIVAISENEIKPFSLKEGRKKPIPQYWIDRIGAHN